MRSLPTALLWLTLPVLALGWLSRVGDPPETVIEFVPAAAPKPICPKSMNPCRIVNCNPRTNTRVYT